MRTKQRPRCARVPIAVAARSLPASCNSPRIPYSVRATAWQRTGDRLRKRSQGTEHAGRCRRVPIGENLGKTPFSCQTITLTYDDLNRLSTKTVYDPNDTPVNTITYTYDLLGRLYTVADNTGTTKNTYDQAGRLIRVEYPGGKTVSYQYDAAGNLVTPDSDPGRTRLTYPDGMYLTYDYDDLTIRRKMGNMRMASVRHSGRLELGVPRLRGLDRSFPPEGGTPNGMTAGRECTCTAMTT